MLTDFGLSKILNTSGFTTKNIGGTCRWMAPELMQYSQDDDAEFGPTKATDVWAFGMTVLEVRRTLHAFTTRNAHLPAIDLYRALPLLPLAPQCRCHY